MNGGVVDWVLVLLFFGVLAALIGMARRLSGRGIGARLTRGLIIAVVVLLTAMFLWNVIVALTWR